MAINNDTDPIESGNQITTLPESDAAPKVGKLPNQYGKIVNLASNKANKGLCENFRRHGSTNVRRCETQDQRCNFVEDGGIMDMADRMLRVSLNRDTTNSQTKDTLSDVTSPMFHDQMRAIHAGTMAILLPDERLPFEYEPEINTNEYEQKDGVAIAQQQNILSEYTWDEDKRRAKFKEIDWYTNKYGLQCISVEWAREERITIEHEPDPKKPPLEDGTPGGFKRVEKVRTVKDWPSLMRHQIEDCYFDAAIPELKNQRWFARKTRMGIEELWAMQEAGWIDNVGDIKGANLYQGEQEQDANISQRQENAGEVSEINPTGEVEVWLVWGRVPIKETKTPKLQKTNAKWDDKGTLATWYEGIYAGRLHSGGAVCLTLRKNPYWHGELPYHLIRSHRDDKGAYSMGYAEMMTSLYWQAVSNINQAIDNVTERNWAPMTVDGPLYTRDLTFKKNKAIKMDRGTTLKRLDIPDTTQITMEMKRLIEEETNKLTGADKPVRAEALGGRTSATEAKNVFDASMLPLDEKAAFYAEQMSWIHEMDAALWRQMGDPKTFVTVSHNGMIVPIKPTEMYGPIKTKVTAVTRFRNNTVKRQEINSMLQNVAPLFAPVMPQEGLVELGRQVFRMAGFENVDLIFPQQDDFDTPRRAVQAAQDMVYHAAWVQPEQDENHAKWISVMEPIDRQLSLLPPEEKAALAEGMGMLKLHIQQRRDLQGQKQQQIAAAAQQAQAPAVPGNEGQITGDRIEAEEGALANV